MKIKEERIRLEKEKQYNEQIRIAEEAERIRAEHHELEILRAKDNFKLAMSVVESAKAPEEKQEAIEDLKYKLLSPLI